MTSPLILKKFSLSIDELNNISEQCRSALLMLGLFVNEANWLRKLLVGAVQGISDQAEGQASFSLAILMATTLAGKMNSGWIRLNKEKKLLDVINSLEMPQELILLKNKLAIRLASQANIHKIRNDIAFHYPELLEFNKLVGCIEASDAVIIFSSKEYYGDFLSHISTLAALEPLLALNNEQDYKVRLKSILDEIANVAALYCQYVIELMVGIINKSIQGGSLEDVCIPDAPEADKVAFQFFMHPPSASDS